MWRKSCCFTGPMSVNFWQNARNSLPFAGESLRVFEIYPILLDIPGGPRLHSTILVTIHSKYAHTQGRVRDLAISAKHIAHFSILFSLIFLSTFVSTNVVCRRALLEGEVTRNSRFANRLGQVLLRNLSLSGINIPLGGRPRPQVLARVARVVHRFLR